MARVFKVTVVLSVIGALAVIAYKHGRTIGDTRNPLAAEIETYYRELPRLLAEGHAGKAVVVKGRDVTVWDTEEDGYQAGVMRFWPAPFLCQPIAERDVEILARFFPAAGAVSA